MSGAVAEPRAPSRRTSEAADKIKCLAGAVSIDIGGVAAASAGARGYPADAASVRPQARARTGWWVEALVIAWLCWVYDSITNLAPLRVHLALDHARGILHLEQALHLDPELTLDRWLAGHHSLGLLLSDYYDNAHFVVTLGLLGWLWWARADCYRALRNTLVIVNVIAFAVFWLYPVAPPRLLPGFTDVVASSHAFGSWHTGALASQANQLAAMPSLHIAWAVWCTLVVWQITRRRWARFLAVVYPCVTALAVLATGNHYVFDLLGGLIAITAAALLVRFRVGSKVLAGIAASGARPVLPAPRTACHKLVTKLKTR